MVSRLWIQIWQEPFQLCHKISHFKHSYNVLMIVGLGRNWECKVEFQVSILETEPKSLSKWFEIKSLKSSIHNLQNSIGHIRYCYIIVTLMLQLTTDFIFTSCIVSFSFSHKPYNAMQAVSIIVIFLNGLRAVTFCALIERKSLSVCCLTNFWDR